jgi:hypothetical protein
MTDVNFSLCLRTISEEDILTSEKENYRSVENYIMWSFIILNCSSNVWIIKIRWIEWKRRGGMENIQRILGRKMCRDETT